MALKRFGERLMACVKDSESIANLAERATADEQFLSRWFGEEESPPAEQDEATNSDESAMGNTDRALAGKTRKLGDFA